VLELEHGPILLLRGTRGGAGLGGRDGEADSLDQALELPRAALGSLYDRFGTVAYQLALRVVRDAALPEDVVRRRQPGDVG
jgi:hypothetical protein